MTQYQSPYPYDPMQLQQPQQSWNYLDMAGLSGQQQPQAPALEVPFSPVSANGTLPVAGPRTGFLGGLGKLGNWMGKNGQTISNWANIGMQGVNAYVGLQQLGLAKDAFKFEKAAFKTNLANSVDSYNTAKQDLLTGRYYATEEERQAAIKAAELPSGMRG